MAKKSSNRKARYVQLSKGHKGRAVLKSVSSKFVLAISIVSFVLAFVFSIVRFTGNVVSDNGFNAFNITGIFLFLLGITLLAIYSRLK